MHPLVRRDLLRGRQFDHVHGRRVAAFLARAAFYLPDWRVPRPTDGKAAGWAHPHRSGKGYWYGIRTNSPREKETASAPGRAEAVFTLAVTVPGGRPGMVLIVS